ncbi:hypothetical protein KP509_19G014600 [Ceratopteris richardii]|uniref:Uncharacterized protein n=1 Tax=Ceratopteris richardii TaxID=49495 RepID=A0A8T2SI98_CERRI|nr:hypothetical protein KP509_19G014600 [Ceratopteris richardii]
MWPPTSILKLLSHGRKNLGILSHLMPFYRSHAALKPHLGLSSVALYATRSHTDSVEHVLPSLNFYDSSRGRLFHLTRSAGSPSHIIWTRDVEEEFEAQPCSKHTWSNLNNKQCDAYRHNLSCRIKAPRAGILDRELLRNGRTRPFTAVKNLDVGVNRDKLRNRKFFSTATLESSAQEDHLITTKAVGSLELSNIIKDDEKIKLNGKPDEDIGILDSDSEEEEDDCCDRSKPSVSAMIKAESIEALDVSLKEMEKCFAPDDVRIGTTALRLAQLYDAADEEPETIVAHAEKALRILQPLKGGSFDIAMCYHVIGSGYYKMDEPEKAITYLEQAADLLDKVGKTEANPKAVGTIKYAGQIFLGHSRMAIDKKEEGLTNYRKALEINERILEPGNPDLARSYQQAAEAFSQAEKHEEAVALCLKALPIYENYFGSASSEVAVLRRLMSLIYDNLGDYENLLNQHRLIRPILVKLGKLKEIASLDLASGEALLSLKRYKDAILKFKEVVKETKETSRFHGHALVLIGKAYAESKEGKNAVKYSKKAFSALKNKKISLEAGSSLMELGSVYQQLNESDHAIGVFKAALTVFEHHPDQITTIAEIEGQIGLLYIFMGKVEEGLPYLERASSKSEEIHGPDSEELLAVYNHIAIAYLEIGKLEEALQKFEAAKRIAVDHFGPEDGDTIAIYSNLVNTYEGLERFDKAIECQKHIVEVTKLGKTNYDVTFEEADRKLRQLMQQA